MTTIRPSALAPTPVARQRTYELVADRLVAAIGEGSLRPGDPIPTERELMEGFRVGRSSVREALRMLESQGVIRVSGGSFVVAEAMNPLNSSLRLMVALDERTGLADLFELRLILECEAASLAAKRRTQADLAEMDAAIAEMEESLGLADGERFIDADLRFHLAVAAATENRLVLHSMHAVRDLLRRALMTVYTIPKSPDRAVVEHRAIREEIEAGDRGQARRAMNQHLTRVEHDVNGGEHG